MLKKPKKILFLPPLLDSDYRICEGIWWKSKKKKEVFWRKDILSP